MRTNPLHLCIALLLVSRPGVVAQPNPPGGPPLRYVEGELLVKFAGGPRGASAEQARGRMQHTVKRHFDFIGWQQIRLPRGMTVEEGLARYRNLPGVEAVEPNAFLEMFDPVPAPAGENLPFGDGAVIPNDPMFNQQYALARVNATNAWAVTTGSTNVVVAIIDTGINYNHEDLAANMWRNPGEIPGNGLDDDGNGYVDDVHGIDTAGHDSDPMDPGIFLPQLSYHGTACAGVAGAVANNGVGIAGVNWCSRLMALRSIGMNQHLVGDFLEAFNYMLLMKSRGVDIRVVSMSWGGTNSFGGAAFLQAVRDAHQAAANAGIVQVAACGNSAADNDVIPNYPRAFNFPGMIDVAASDQNDLLASFSNYGRTNVDLAAPGVSVTTTYAPGTNVYTQLSGTSFSCPMVAGAAALLFAVNPSATIEDVKAALLESVDVLPAFTNKMVSNGRLNIGRAVLHPRIATGPPAFITQPQPLTAVLSNSANLSALGGGTRPLHYQWRFNGLELPEATNAALPLLSVGLNQAGEYAVAITNALGSITSQVARLTVVPLLITAQPLSQNIRLTSNVTFAVSVSSPVPVTYQWRFNDADIAGANAPTLLLTNVQPHHGGRYSVRVANEFGAAVSSNAALVVLLNPVISLAPASNLTNIAGATFTLGVAIVGQPPPFFYVWRSNAVVIRSNFFAGATSDFVTVRAPITPGLSNTFRVEVTNLFGTILTTFTNRLFFTNHTVADSDGDGLPDGYESAYGGAGGMLDPLGDADGDTLGNLAEYRAGTNPTNAASVLKLDSILAGAGAALQFEAVANRTYTLQYSPAPGAGPWSNLFRFVPLSTNHLKSVFDPEQAPHRIYRVRLD